MTGEVEFILDGKSETLRSTLRAAKAVNSMGGFQEAWRRLAAMDLEAYVAVVAAGLGKTMQEVEGAVFRTGLPQLSEPAALFVGYLANGGKARDTTSEESGSGEG
jgi:hypothetical protein